MRPFGPAGRPVSALAQVWPPSVDFQMRAARPAAVHPPLRAAPLIGRGVERLAVRGIHHQLGRAGVVIDVQHALPVLPAVGGLVDAAFAASRPQVAQRRHVDDVEVHRVDDDAGDLLAVAQAHVLPRAAAIRGLVDAVAPRAALPVVVLARCRPTPGWHRSAAMAISPTDELPSLSNTERERGAVVRGLVDAAGGGADVEHRWVAFEHGEVVHPARRRGRPDRAEGQPIERPAARRLLGPHRRRPGWRLRHDGRAERGDEAEHHHIATSHRDHSFTSVRSTVAARSPAIGPGPPCHMRSFNSS